MSRQRVLLLLGSGLLALVLAEACLWLLDIPKNISSFRFLGNVFDMADVAEAFEEDLDLFWRLRPDTNLYRVNDMGLRGPEVARKKSPRDLRVACFGDSCTFGSHVRLEDTYAWLLQESLQKELPNRRVQAILAGLPGFSSYQSLMLFQKHIAARKPDITVLYIGGYNDYVPAMLESDVQRGIRLWSEWTSRCRWWRRLGIFGSSVASALQRRGRLDPPSNRQALDSTPWNARASCRYVRCQRRRGGVRWSFAWAPCRRTLPKVGAGILPRTRVSGQDQISFIAPPGWALRCGDAT